MSRISYKLPKEMKSLVNDAIELGKITVDELDCSISFSRQPTSKSVQWIIKNALKSKQTFWNLIYRDMSFMPDGIHYYDFGCRFGGKDNKDYFLWVHLDISAGQHLIAKYNLTPINYEINNSQSTTKETCTRMG